MKNEQSSSSAEGVAGFRAYETSKPEQVRVIDDPYAIKLLPRSTYALIKIMFDTGLYERMAPGAIGFVIVRERYIDDILKSDLAAGLDQVVILGAGFDTRAYRIPGIEKTRVFEIDHPATQAEKLKRMKKLIDPLPAYVTFVPVDFNTQTLGDCLKSSGYDEGAKTLFIWQGVTYFLTEQGVDSTLAFIAEHSGAGSSVIFDYFYNETLHDSTHGYGKALRRAQKLSGEEYMFGIDQGQLETFMTRRGFYDVQNKSLDELKAFYFTGPNAGRQVPSGIAIALANVNNVKA
jgi:methyltransferase (TIGR00027 family)